MSSLFIPISLLLLIFLVKITSVPLDGLARFREVKQVIDENLKVQWFR